MATSMPIVRAMQPTDWPSVHSIYAEGSSTGDATFDTRPPNWAHFDATRLPTHRFVAVSDDGFVLGWVAVSRVSPREAYAGVVEDSVYVAASASGQGVGRALLAALIASTEIAGIWTIQSGIFPENGASLALHERMGFRRVGTRERAGRLAGRWRDVVLVERRSPVVR